MKFVLKNITIISLILLTATSVCFRKFENKKVKTEKPEKGDNGKGQGLNDSKLVPTKVESETESSKSSDLSRKNSLKDNEFSSDDDNKNIFDSATFPYKNKALKKKSDNVKSFTDDDLEKQSNIFFPSSKDDSRTKNDKTSLKLHKSKSFLEDEKSNARKTNLTPLDVSNSIELNREGNDPQTPKFGTFGTPDGFIKGSNISFGKKKKL